jgi:hypothetical protein
VDSIEFRISTFGIPSTITITVFSNSKAGTYVAEFFIYNITSSIVFYIFNPAEIALKAFLDAPSSHIEN